MSTLSLVPQPEPSEEASKAPLTLPEFVSYLEALTKEHLHGNPRATEQDVRRAQNFSLASVMFDLAMACVKTEDFINRHIKRFDGAIGELTQKLTELRAYSEATRRLPAFSGSLQMQTELDALRATDRQQAAALADIRDQISALQTQVNGDPDQEDTLWDRVQSLNARLSDVEDDVRQLCNEVFEDVDDDGNVTLIARVDAIEEAVDDLRGEPLVIGSEDEDEDEDEDDSLEDLDDGPSAPFFGADYHVPLQGLAADLPMSSADLPAEVEKLFHELFGVSSDEAYRGGLKFKVEDVKVIKRFPHPTDKRGQPGNPRPEVNEFVPGAVAREDMINHPDSVYGLKGGGVRYRFHDGDFQLKQTWDDEFETRANDFCSFMEEPASFMEEPAALLREYFRVATNEPPVEQTASTIPHPCKGDMVGFDKALPHMTGSAAVVYGILDGSSRVFRVVEGRLVELAPAGARVWARSPLDFNRIDANKAKWVRLNDCDPKTGQEVENSLAEMVAQAFATASKPVVITGTLGDTSGRPKAGTTVSWEQARKDMLDHPEARYAPVPGEGVIYRINPSTFKIECKDPGFLKEWHDSHFNKGCVPDQLQWMRQSDEPGTAIVKVGLSVGAKTSFEAALAYMKDYPESRFSPTDHDDSQFVYRVSGGRLQCNVSKNGCFAASVYDGAVQRGERRDAMLKPWVRKEDGTGAPDAATLGRTLPNVRR